MLVSEALERVQLSANGSHAVNKRCHNACVGYAIHDSGAISVDPMVPLAEARLSGAYAGIKDCHAARPSVLGDAGP